MLIKLTTLIRRSARAVTQSLGINPTPSLCENTPLWAFSRDWGLIRLHDAFTLNFEIPNTIKDYPHIMRQFEINSSLGFPAQYLVTIPNATIKAATGFITTQEGAYLTEGHWRVSNVTGHPIFRNEWPIKHKRYLSGDWYCAMGHWGANYNHWLWDEMPRLLTALPYLPQNTKFLVPEPLSTMQRDSLLALGIKSEQLVTQSYNCESTVEDLWFATPLGHSEWAATSPTVAIQLRETFLKAYGVEKQSGNRRIYISRSQAKYRRLINEDELLPELQKFGFEVIRPETLSFEEQVRTFSQAGIIMGVHGAGLTNMLFAPEGAKIVEIHGPNVTRTHYWMMANILNLNYRCLLGKETFSTINKQTKEPDFYLEKHKLFDLLETQLSDTTCN